MYIVHVFGEFKNIHNIIFLNQKDFILLYYKNQILYNL